MTPGALSRKRLKCAQTGGKCPLALFTDQNSLNDIMGFLWAFDRVLRLDERSLKGLTSGYGLVDFAPMWAEPPLLAVLHWCVCVCPASKAGLRT